MAKAVIFGCAGLVLSREEARFFRETDPVGFILFARNLSERAQIIDLIKSLRETIGRTNAPILIDQEGGRVARLRPPQWRTCAAAARYASLYEMDPDSAVEASRLNGRLMGAELADLGFSVNCAPVLDLRFPGAHEVVGDRAYGATPEQAATLGRALAEGLLLAGIIPVIKHIPGHGRATIDSHFALPQVQASWRELEATDFEPFRRLRDMPWAMTAHVLFEAIDPVRPASLSPDVVGEVIRGSIGFDGLLLCDDLSMAALGGPIGARARDAIAAGCDIALHCNGKMDEMLPIAEAVPELSEMGAARLARGQARCPAPRPFDRASEEARLAALLGAAETAHA
jgi:beta-N-acetylhexosaminidase